MCDIYNLEQKFTPKFLFWIAHIHLRKAETLQADIAYHGVEITFNSRLILSVNNNFFLFTYVDLSIKIPDLSHVVQIGWPVVFMRTYQTQHTHSARNYKKKSRLSILANTGQPRL